MWAHPTVSPGAPSLVVQRDIAYVGAGSPLASIAAGGGGRVWALRAGDGTELWSFPTLGDGPASLTTAPGVIYVSDGGLVGMGVGDGGRVTALRAADGAGLWALRTGGSSPQLLQADGVIYATARGPFPEVAGETDTAADSRVCALRSASGGQIWSLTFPWPEYSVAEPLAVGRGIAYVAASDGTVRALRSQGA